MKLKINKACDLSSISVLPPHSRRTNAIPHGPDSSVFGKSQASQLRSQSQQSFSQGISSQLGMSSQLSQNSLEEIVNNEQKLGSQERETSVKRMSCLAPITYTREESQSQMPISRSSSNLMRKWGSTSVPDHRCKLGEELDHRIGLMETSLNRFGMILDSIQSDVMQTSRAMKEISLEMEGMRQKFVVLDNSLHLMLKGKEDIKASIDGSLKFISDQLGKDLCHDKLQEAVSIISALPDRIEVRLTKLKTELYGSFAKEIKEICSSPKGPNIACTEPKTHLPKKRSTQATRRKKEEPNMECKAMPPKVKTRVLDPRIETGSWDLSVPASFISRKPSTEQRIEEIPLTQQEREWRVIIDSDEEIDDGFSFLLEEKKKGIESYLTEEANEETEKILKKARRRKRKCLNPIILN